MPPRDPALPEGTDHIIQGAAGSSGTSASGGGSTMGGSTAGGGGSSSGFVASGGGGSDTGGTASSGGSGTGSNVTSSGGNGGGSGSSSGGSDRMREQIRNQVYSLRDQATEKARQLADDGKGRATSLLDDFGGVIDDAARAIEERFGPEYASYAQRAADSVSSLSETLNRKDLDELLDDTRGVIRRSPGIAIGVAAVLGFALVRVLKTGMNDMSGSSGGSDRSRSGTKSSGGTGTGTGTGGA